MNNINNFLDPIAVKSFETIIVVNWAVHPLKKNYYSKPVLRKRRGLLKLQLIF